MLTAAAQTNAIQVQGTVESNYRAAYDILVRPTRATTALEDKQGLVRPNFLSGVFGGITMKQWQEIRSIVRVDVAAPIANIGYVLPFANAGVSLEDMLTPESEQLYRVASGWRAHRDQSRYPGTFTQYVYFSKSRSIEHGDCVLGRANGPLQSLDPWQKSVFTECFTRGPNQVESSVDIMKLLPRGTVGVRVVTHFPVVISAIDPVEEARLLGVDRALVSGRYLRGDDRARVHRFTTGGSGVRIIPIIASSRVYLDERLELAIEKLPLTDGNVFPKLATGRGEPFLESLRGTLIERKPLSPAFMYESLLGSTQAGVEGRFDSVSYWTTSPTKYRVVGPDRVAPVAVTNPKSVWQNPLYSGRGGGLGYMPAPPSNRDVQFRQLESHPGDNRFDIAADIYRTPRLQLVGRFDPEKLPGFSPLSEVPLETYYPPLLEGADDRSRDLLGGKPLLPTQNLGDYIQQPPLFLTTLKAIGPFLNPRFFGRVEGRARAPISAIRVRVAGVTGPDEVSQARVRAVAQQIHERTGLQVDITAGSSPKPILVELPAGKFGRPELLLQEGWSKKGAAVSFVEALDRKSVGLSALVLLVSVFFVGNGTLASVRGRRREIGTLRTVGWSATAVFAVVLGEVAVIGLAAGVVGTGVAAGAARLLRLELPLWQALLVAPLALLLALVAGALPAWRAAAVTPLDAIRPPVVATRRSRRVRGFVSMALVNLSRVPGRTLLAAAALAIGVAALTSLVAIQRAFEGVLVDTLLGNAISFQVRGPDLAAITLLIGLAGISIADVLYLSLRERSAEIGTLRTLGWGDRHLGRLIATEALLLGVTATGAGAALGVLVAAQLAIPLSTALAAAALAVAGGVAISVLATVLPLLHLRSLAPATALARE